MLSIHLAVLVLLQLQVADFRLKLCELVHQFLIGIAVIVFLALRCADHGHVEVLVPREALPKLNIVCI